MKTDISRVVETTDADFTQLKDTTGVLLVDFGADWCGPCKMMEPVLNQLAEDFTGLATVARLDVDTNAQTTTEYRVRNLPTFLLFKDGQLAHRLVGATSKHVLAQEINRLLLDKALSA